MGSKGRQRGDLSALLELSNDRRWGDPNPARLQRLGFIKRLKTTSCG
jgi:hypothetical protein